MSAALALVLAQLLQSPPSSPSLKAARAYFEEFEYGKCVRRAEQAAREEQTDAGLAEVEVLTGLCKFHLGQEADAATHFRVALRLDPTVTLPPYTSPRVVALFQAEASRRPPAPDPVRANAVPAQEPEVSAGASSDAPKAAALVPAAPVPAPAFAPSASPARAEGHRSLILPAALGGVAVLTAGGGALFGLEARRLETVANSAAFESDFHVQGAAAQRSALVANACFGTAALAATGAVVSYLLAPR